MKRNFLFLFSFLLCTFGVMAQPAAPANIVATPDPTTLTVNVTWTDLANPPNAEDGFSIVTKDSSGVTVDSNTVAADVQTYTTPALAVGMYTVQVQSFSGVAAPYTFNATPPPAVNVTVSSFNLAIHNLSVDLGQVSNNLAVVSWDNTSSQGADGFKILLTNVDNNTTQTILAPFGQSVRTLGGLMGGTNYTAQIQAYNGTTDGPLSNIVYWTTNPDVPSAPTVTITKACPFEVIGSISSPDVNRVETYTIQKSFNNSTWIPLATNNVSNKFFYDAEENEIRGRTVWYRAFASNVTGLSLPSASVAVQVPDYVKPPAPMNLRATDIAPDGLTFRWDFPFNNQDNVCRTNLIGSVNYRYSVNGGPVVVGSDFPQTQSLTISGLGMRDTVRIEVWYLNDRSTILSDIVNTTARTLGPPDAPTDFIVIGYVDGLGYSNVAMVARDNSEDEDGFEYFVGLSPNVEEMVSVGKTKFALGIGSEITFIQKPVQEGVQYYYALRAFNYLGNGEFTPVLPGMMEYSRIPGIPVNLKASSSDAGVTVSWSDNSFVEQYYVIERSSDGGATYDSVGTAGMNEFTFVDATASAGDVLMYRVRSVNPVGSSDPSKPVMIDLTPSTGGDDEGAPEARVALYPNPTVSTANIIVAQKFNGTKGQIQVINQNFREVLKQQVSFTAEGVELDISNLPEGLYNVVITTEEGKISKKIQKF